MFSLESPHRHTIYNILNLQLWYFFQGFQEEFEMIAVVNKPSVFELLKVYCGNLEIGTITNH